MQKTMIIYTNNLAVKSKQSKSLGINKNRKIGTASKARGGPWSANLFRTYFVMKSK